MNVFFGGDGIGAPGPTPMSACSVYRGKGIFS